MNFLGNIIWFIFGGFFAALGYFVGGLVLCITVVGIPFGLQCFKLAGAVLFPFGKQVVNDSASAGCFTLFANIIWILCGGLWTALNHLVWGIILTLTIIGIPFAKQHFKLIELSLMPFGKNVV
ncbi:YccF domain-containing protein [Taibaiella lutea]|uniref:YccF domain-containing protein n=1 Tax=Taibaiella lutea TaxID=2608001 RepID=A0A5M6CJ04_9BACT|nr:YccF domain-containing protein [Taibaiella lutea]KAA5535006.1 YccF domain-containing protein [Taibaiella lutea]